MRGSAPARGAHSLRKVLTMKRPSPSLVVSILALVVATGGTSYAAATVGTDDIEANAVTSAKIATENVGSLDIKDGTIRNRDLSADTRRGLQGPRGAAGADGRDGQDGDDATTRWALVGVDGEIVSQSGGFTVTAGYPVTPGAANGNVYIDTGEDLVDNGIVATLTLQNTSDAGGPADVNNGSAPGADMNPEFSGEVTVSRCNFPGNTGAPIPANCAPAGTQTMTHLVVSPRMSDGTRTADADSPTPAVPSTRKAFYVFVTS